MQHKNLQPSCGAEVSSSGIRMPGGSNPLMTGQRMHGPAVVTPNMTPGGQPTQPGLIRQCAPVAAAVSQSVDNWQTTVSGQQPMGGNVMSPSGSQLSGQNVRHRMPVVSGSVDASSSDFGASQVPNVVTTYGNQPDYVAMTGGGGDLERMNRTMGGGDRQQHWNDDEIPSEIDEIQRRIAMHMKEYRDTPQYAQSMAGGTASSRSTFRGRGGSQRGQSLQGRTVSNIGRPRLQNSSSVSNLGPQPQQQINASHLQHQQANVQREAAMMTASQSLQDITGSPRMGIVSSSMSFAIPSPRNVPRATFQQPSSAGGRPSPRGIYVGSSTGHYSPAQASPHSSTSPSPVSSRTPHSASPNRAPTPQRTQLQYPFSPGHQGSPVTNPAPQHVLGTNNTERSRQQQVQHGTGPSATTSQMQPDSFGGCSDDFSLGNESLADLLSMLPDNLDNLL